MVRVTLFFVMCHVACVFNYSDRAKSMVELCTAYFFIGHHGSISKEDVRAAYDVSTTIALSCNMEYMYSPIASIGLTFLPPQRQPQAYDSRQETSIQPKGLLSFKTCQPPERQGIRASHASPVQCIAIKIVYCR